MILQDLSLGQLEQLAHDPNFATFLSGLLVQTYDDFIEVLYKDIDLSIKNLEESAELYQKCEEDLLSHVIATYLRGKGYSATHDEKHRGHCDILVRKGNYKWIGEAKIHGAYDTLFKGFQQLNTRYSTGDINQTAGGMIIYIRGKNAKRVMETWETHLKGKNLPDLITDTPPRESLAFFSTHTHEGSGLSFKVRHMPVLLYFNPEDRD